MKIINTESLIDKGLLIAKPVELPCGINATMLKYHNKVFYNNLWEQHPMLKECRGSVIDNKGDALILPFKKVYNLGENGTAVPPETYVHAVKKINGFMAAVTKVNGNWIVSTTGSLTSDHVNMAKDKLGELLDKRFPMSGKFTYLFEICHEDDPHIVEEVYGAYLIGIRNIYTGDLCSESVCDNIAKSGKWLRPTCSMLKFGKLQELLKRCKHEGFMVRDYSTGTPLCKLKSPFYLSKKFIMRLGKAKVEAMFEDPELMKERIDEEFYGVIDEIVHEFSMEDWKALSDQDRRDFIEDFFEG